MRHHKNQNAVLLSIIQFSVPPLKTRSVATVTLATSYLYWLLKNRNFFSFVVMFHYQSGDSRSTKCRYANDESQSFIRTSNTATKPLISHEKSYKFPTVSFSLDNNNGIAVKIIQSDNFPTGSSWEKVLIPPALSIF